MRDNNNNKDDNGELVVVPPKKRKKRVKKHVVKRQKVDTKPVELCGRKKEYRRVVGANGLLPLTIKQEEFCRCYLELGSATAAYAAAYDSAKMKRSTINSKAYVLIGQPHVAARINEMRQIIDAKWAASKEKTIKRLMQGQEFDIRGLYDEAGRLKHPHELDDNAARGVCGVRYDKEGNLVEYKIIDIKGCAELLGRHLRLFADKVEVDVNVTHKMSDDELAQRIARIEQSVQRIAAGGDVPRIASQPEPIDAEFTTREDYLRNIIDNTKITGNDLRDAQAALLELDEINKQKE